jgi:hypothetical protein
VVAAARHLWVLTSARVAERVTTAQATPDNPATVDLLVVYTSGFRQSLGSTAAAAARVDYVVDLVNQAFLDSGVYAHLRLVHTAEVAYPDDTDSASALDDLQGLSAGGTPESLSSVAPMRAQYHADVVSMMRAFDPDTQDCGVSAMIGYNLAPITGADAWKAFSVVDDQGAAEGCSGLAGYQLADELGSNFGLRDQYFPGNVPGAYSFSFAYQRSTPSGPFPTKGTLRADSYPGYAWPYFSNPNINLCDGGPCGIPDQSDAARSLNLTLPVIATFERTTFTHNDLDGDGKSDLFWYGTNGGAVIYWLMDGAKMVTWKGLTVPAGYQPAAIGDFNGDHRADILWTDGSNHLYMWVNDGAGGFTNHFVTTYNAYRVSGTADVDGDGKSDIIWRNPTAGGMIYWLMDGWTMKSWRSFSLKPINHLAGVGDFNGDGRTDLLWAADSTRNVYAWFGNGSGGFTGVLVNTYQPGWGVAGVGDANGDGKSDIFWYNQGTGQFTYWLMNGATKTSWRGFTVDKSYRPITIADYNGNGRADILWTNDARELLMSVDNGAGGFNPQHVTQYSTNYVPFGN